MAAGVTNRASYRVARGHRKDGILSRERHDPLLIYKGLCPTKLLPQEHSACYRDCRYPCKRIFKSPAMDLKQMTTCCDANGLERQDLPFEADGPSI